jgi:dihydroxyacetone kinase DhaKLM complex PTS-EIIA-like component DhaM
MMEILKLGTAHQNLTMAVEVLGDPQDCSKTMACDDLSLFEGVFLSAVFII